MKSEEVTVIVKNLESLRALDKKIQTLGYFIEETKTRQDIRVGNGSTSLYFSQVDLYGFVGDDILKILEYKLTQLEKQFHNYTLEDLLKVNE